MEITCECGNVLPEKVLRSAAGYYLGHFCPRCGPYDRTSGYFPTAEAAQRELDGSCDLSE
jgi:hypothetical protein